jgi:hypothetical protein
VTAPAPSPRRRARLAADAGAAARRDFALARKCRLGPDADLRSMGAFLAQSPEAVARYAARTAAARARRRARRAGELLPPSLLHNGKARRNAR